MRKSMLRAAFVAFTLAAAMPMAHAAGPFDLWGGENLFLDGPSRVCLFGNGQIRRAIERQGYTKIYLNVQNGRYIQARATRGEWVYLLDVNACTGRVLDRERLRPA
jgi:hypothetical protein